MKKSFRFTAKKVEKAISDGLSALGVQMDEVEVNIISTGGIFKKAEVEIILTVPDEVVEPVAAPKLEPVKTEKTAPAQPAAAKENNAPQSQKHEKPFNKASQAKKEHNQNNNKKHEKPAAASNQNAQPAFAARFAQNSGDSLNQQSQEVPEFLNDKKAGGKNNNPNKLFSKNPVVEKPKFKERKNDRGPATIESKQAADEFLTNLFKLSGFDATFESTIEEGLMIKINTENASIIGHRGETLDSLQYLTSLYVNGGKEKFVVVGMDALGYREKRKDALRRLAQKMADKCLANNRRMGLEPMNSADRKEIHAYLNEIGGVVTRSEGYEPNRRIVIYPERKR